MYRLFGHLVSEAFNGETKEVRLQAASSLAAMLGAVGLVGGISELPTEEPAKVIGLTLKMLGLTQSDWSDFKRGAHEWMAKEFGRDAAGYAMHGFGGLTGVDIASRLGYGSGLTGINFPEGSVNRDKLYAWAMGDLLGAPGSLVASTLGGLSTMSAAVMDGDIASDKVVDGLFKALPLTALRDVQKAVKGESYFGQYKMSGFDRAAHILGFTPEAEAQFGSRQRDTKTLKEEYQDQKQTLLYGYADAKNAGERLKIRAKVARFNETMPPMARITPDMLNSTLRNKQEREHEDTRHHLGQSFGKGNSWIADRDRLLYGK
jgi:hypothetical protein